MFDISTCQCIVCGGRLLVAAESGRAIVAGRYACEACEKQYDEAWGVPLLLEFDDADFVGLVEIAANAHDIAHYTPDGIEFFIDLLKRYHTAADRDALCAEAGPIVGPWLPVRYNDWVAIETLMRGDSLVGKDVLDVGAGLGFDAYRHVMEGANVTALEHNPILAREGARTLPMIRWISGASHALPFAAGSFDAVFCNAALHHMRDVPTAVREMLRVLRPGGMIVTTGDPFRADHDGEELELAVFNTHPDVLMGVNEQVPRFASFVETLEQLRAYIEPRLFTQLLRENGSWGKRVTEDFKEWLFDADRARLGAGSGSLAMRVTLKSALPPAPRTPLRSGLPRPAVVADWLDRPAEAVAKLAAWAPETIVNRPFPGVTPSKAELLNGWQAPTGDSWRQAYRRGRWYLRRNADEVAVTFELRTAAPESFEILLNNEKMAEASTGANQWASMCIDLTNAPIDAPFVLEVRLAGKPASFEAGLFRVRKRRIVGARGADPGERLRGGIARLKLAGVTRLKSLIRQQIGSS